jgi:hypothetical protein
LGKAILDGDTVIVSSDEIQQPVAVRSTGDKTPLAIFTTRKGFQLLRSERMIGRPRRTKNSGVY